jgi:hypothetical protein
MTYDELVKYIRGEGCRVYVYKHKKTIYGGSKGTFDGYAEHGPIICVATKDVEPERSIETLLHEFGHFLQWQDGFLQYLDGICDTYELEHEWIKGKIEFTPCELKIVRNTMLALEYDAEKRGCEAGCWLGPNDFSKEFYLQGAAAYMDSIKWEFARRIPTCDVPDRYAYEGRLLTNDELFEDMKEERLVELDGIFKRRKGKFQL